MNRLRQGEHFGIVPLEAMAAMRPVIACDSGGPRESVLHGETGYLCRPDPVAIAAAMAQLTVRAQRKFPVWSLRIIKPRKSAWSVSRAKD